MSIYIRRDISPDEIYSRARQEKNGKVRSRLLAIAAIIEGKNRTYAAKLAGIALTNIRRWINRFNEKGLDGLEAKKQPGKTSLWTDEVEQFLKKKALQGPNFESDKRVIYRLKDFQAMILERFGLELSLSTIWYKLKSLKLSWISVRPQHPKSNPLEQEEFKKKSLLLLGKYKNNIQLKY